jgi:hypothetical protein
MEYSVADVWGANVAEFLIAVPPLPLGKIERD